MTRKVTSRARQGRSRKLRATSLLTTGAAILLAAFLAGCGSSSDSSTGSEQSLPPRVVTDSDIEAQPDGSPQRALLEWWQAFQFGDPVQVLARTSPDTIKELGEKNLSELASNTGPGLQGIEVLDSTETGNTASVRVGLLQFTPAKEGEPPPSEPTSSTPDTFTMEKQGEEWLFADTDFLVPKLQSYQDAQKQQSQKK
jgi:hypothetical protein